MAIDGRFGAIRRFRHCLTCHSHPRQHTTARARDVSTRLPDSEWGSLAPGSDMTELGYALPAARLADLSDIEVAVRIEPPSVSRLAGVGVPAPSRNQVAVEIPDRNPVSAALLHHVGNVAVKEYVARANEVCPLGQVVAVNIENLDPVIFAVANVDPVIFIDTDLVQDRKLARPGAGFAP